MAELGVVKPVIISVNEKTPWYLDWTNTVFFRSYRTNWGGQNISRVLKFMFLPKVTSVNNRRRVITLNSNLCFMYIFLLLLVLVKWCNYNYQTKKTKPLLKVNCYK